MTNFFKLLNRYWPVVTGIALLCGYLIYAVGFWLSKGIELGFGVNSQLGSDKEVMLIGTFFTLYLLPQILIEGVLLLLTSWSVYVGLLLGVGIGFILLKLQSDKAWKTVERIEGGNNILIAIVVFFYIFVSLPEAAKNKGIEHAQNKIAKVNDTNCSTFDDFLWAECVEITFSIEGKVHYLKGLLLHEHDSKITIFLPGEHVAKTVTLPSNAVISRRYQAPEAI